MYAQCPECLTFFRVRPEQLKAAHGQVRCSQCKHVFNALETLRGDLSAEELRAVSDAKRAADKAADAPLLKDQDLHGDLFENLDYIENEELPLGEPVDDEERAELEESTGSIEPHHGFAGLPHTHFHLPKSSRHPAMTTLLVIANLLLLAGMGAQWVHHERAQLLKDPRFSGLLQQAYERIGFPLEATRDLRVIKVSRSNVASHPDVPNALYLTAVVENRGQVAQPWPQIRIDLEDRWGETVGARYFTAAEYLRDPTSASQPMHPHEPYSIDLAILDPGAEAVGYQVDACLAKGNRHVCVTDLDQ